MKGTRIAVAMGILLAASCGPPPPGPLGVVDGALMACPPTRNCTRTGTAEVPHLRLTEDSPAAWESLVAIVAAMPRTVIVTRTEEYLHAQVRTRVFRFVDDLELYRPPGGEVQVRSAARSGSWDLGVNARRVDRLRKLLASA